MDLKLEGKIVIVTGGAAGMGLAYSKAFAAEGAKVCIFDVNPQAGEAARSEIVAGGGEARFFRVDVSQWQQVHDAVEAVVAEFGRIDVLVNNAGIRLMALLEETTDEIWERQMQVNLKGVFHTCKAVVPHMKAQRYGKIVNVSSLSGRRGHVLRGAAYAASKAGIDGLTRSLARELSGYGINVNGVAPSLIRTAFMDDFSPEDLQRMAKNVPIGRLGEPEDLVGIVLLLASDRAGYIHGQIINVDGGQLMS